MKTMKTFLSLKQDLLKSVLFIVVATSAFNSSARSVGGLQTRQGSVRPGFADQSFFITPSNKLASFTASINNKNKVDLKWTTEVETGLSHIMVEKSTDGMHFKDAALVFTYGNTTSKSDYAFRDNISQVKAGPVYYRLRIVDNDGTTQYSDTLLIDLSNKEKGSSSLSDPR
jgi:hypothetical protein